MTTEKESRIPENAPQPQDHKKKKSAEAREAEAGDGYVLVEQCGVELRVPIKGKVPIKALMAFRAGEQFEGSRLLLGDEQWVAFLDADPLAEDFAELGDKIQEAAGN